MDPLPASGAPVIAARPRTLVLVVEDDRLEAALIGPTGGELPGRLVTTYAPAAPVATTLQALWPALEPLGEFDRITIGLGVGLAPAWTPPAVVAALEDQAGRRARAVLAAQLRWSPLLRGVGVELVLVLDAPLRSELFLDGAPVPGLALGRLRARKRRTFAEYLDPGIAERKGARAWGKRVQRGVDDVLAGWAPQTLYVTGPGAALLSPELALPPSVVVLREPAPLAGALAPWSTR